MSLLKNSVEQKMMKYSTVSLDTCVWSNLARYRDIVIKGEKSIYYGKYDEDFMKEYGQLYEMLKNNTGNIVVPLVAQIEIASSYNMFVPIMRVIDELNAELKPFPSPTLMAQMKNFTNPKNIKTAQLTPTQILILGKYYDAEKHKELVSSSEFLKPLLKAYAKQFKMVDPRDVSYYQNVASILSLIYRSENINGNRMMAIKDMFDSIMLAECQMYGANYFFTNNVNDFKKSINYSLGDVDNDPARHFVDNVVKSLYAKYVKEGRNIDPKSMVSFFKEVLRENYDDFDLLLLGNIAARLSKIEKDETYQKFLATLSRVIHTQRKELKVSIVKRNSDFLDFIKGLDFFNCKDKILNLWRNTIDKTSSSKNSDLVEAIYEAQGIHEKNDDDYKKIRRQERIKQLFDVESEDELIDSLTYSLLKYKRDLNKRKNDVEVKFVGIK